MEFDIANQSNVEAARVGFRAAFLAQLGLVTERPLEKLLLNVPSTTTLEEWEWLGDFPSFEEWTGDRIMDVMSAFKLQVKNKDWSSGLRVHQNQFKDDKIGLFPIGVAGLAEAARDHRAVFAAQLLINGFDGTPFPDVSKGLAYDGKFYFSATHATGSNLVTAHKALDLTGTGLDEAELLLESQTSYNGKRKLRIKGTDLIVGPTLRPIAERLMTSDYLIAQAGVGPVSNYFKGRYNIIIEPWLAGPYANYWFLADTSKPVKPCLFQLREEITTSAIIGGQGTAMDAEPRFKRGELWFGAEARYNVAAFEHRLIAGSKGA